MATATKKKDALSESLGSLASILDKGKKQKEQAVKAGNDVYQEIPLGQIEEDPHQPRTEFDQEFLKWLAGDIKNRGVQQPISVQPQGENGKFRINAGAQRYRASGMAGKETIPAVIKADFDKYDQVNENDGREGLTTRDQSRFISRCLEEGDSKSYIAQRLRINNSEITELLSFQKLPAEIIDMLYTPGIVTEQGPLYQLYLCYKEDQEKTLAYCKKIVDDGNTSVRALKTFKKTLKVPKAPVGPEGDDTGQQQGNEAVSTRSDDDNASADGDKKGAGAGETTVPATKVKKPLVMVRHEERNATLLINKPATRGVVWIQYEDGSQVEAVASTVVLDSIVDASTLE